MNAEQKRLADALNRLDITLIRISGLVLALEYLLDESSGATGPRSPVTPAILAVRSALEDNAWDAEHDIALVWDVAKPILRWEVRHA